MADHGHEWISFGSWEYRLALMIAVGGSFLFWSRRILEDGRQGWILAAALVGSLLGAKVGYLIAEAWLYWKDPSFIPRLAVGKTVIGGLIGGYLGVEVGKMRTGYVGTTGDRFALIVPVSLGLGRYGCVVSGCCQGVVLDWEKWIGPRNLIGAPVWPAPHIELVFHVVSACLLYRLWRSGRFVGQLFHLYLMGYAVFRFGHEFLRDTPVVACGLSGYQFLCLVLLGLAAYRFRERQGKPASGSG